MPQKRVLLVGDFRHGDFRDAEAWLRAHTQLTTATTIAEALSHLAAGPPPDFAWVKSVEVIDDYTVKVTANAWSNQILPFISRKSWSVFSPTAYQSMGKDKMDTNPVGTGAFKLKSFTANQSLVLEKFADYYMKDADGNQLPYLDGIEIQIFQDPTTMVMAVQSGQVDGADHIPPTGAQQLSADKNFSIEHFGGPVDMLTMNMTDAASVWSKVQMRQAL